MFDTIKLTFCEFVAKDLSNWKLCSDISDNAFNPVKIRQNNEFLGNVSYDLEKAFYNTDKINMTIKAINNTNYLIVNFSIPKFLYGNNVSEFQADDFEKLFYEINREITMSGIFANFETANISRLDFCSNIKTDYSFSVYKGLFSYIQSSRLKKVEYDGETFYWRNKSRELKIYDKVKDVEKKEGITLDYNLMRFEKSLLKKHTHKDLIQLKDLKDNDKIKDSIVRYYDDLFNLLDIKTFPDSSLDLWAMIEEFKKIYPKQHFSELLKFYGAINLFKDMPENIIDEFFTDCFSRSKRFKYKKIVNDILKNQNVVKKIDNKKLHSELMEKLGESKHEKIKSL